MYYLWITYTRQKISTNLCLGISEIAGLKEGISLNEIKWVNTKETVS